MGPQGQNWFNHHLSAGKLYMFANRPKITKKVQGVKMGAIGGNLIYKFKSGLGILNQAPDVPFSVYPQSHLFPLPSLSINNDPSNTSTEAHVSVIYSS